MLLLCSCVYHVFDEDAVAGGGVVDENMGNRADQLAILDDGAAAHQCVNIGPTFFSDISH